LVAKDYTQDECLDFTKTFNPVIESTTIRLVLSLAVINNWSIKQHDINNAFHHEDFNEMIYMAQPLGFINFIFSTHVCRMHKVIYGLHQSPRVLYHKLSETLLQLSFTTSSSDLSLFLYKQSINLVFLLIYVDGIILIGNNSFVLYHFTLLLDQKFTIKYLESLHFFLSIES
jgi:Reverse transcriptase (RNA-dependent DNA polymerase)